MRLAVLAFALVLGQGAVAQTTPAAPAPGAVLILDSDRLYQDSRYGQQIRARLDADAAALKAENDRIVAALTEEERSLTTRRPTLTPEAFRKEAQEFDTKVQGIRRARDTKEIELQTARATAQKDFYGQVQAIVGQIMLERGAAVTLDQRSVFVALSAADITQDAIARIDATFVDAPSAVVPDSGALLEGNMPDAPPDAAPEDADAPPTLTEEP